MKNALFTICFFTIILFNACKYPITVSNYGNTPEETRKYSLENISESQIYIVENTEKIYDTTQIFNGTYYAKFKNPSFELDNSQHSQTPTIWQNCADLHSSPVDIHGYNVKHFSVKQMANHGNNFVGMITRSDGTYEAIGQNLENSLDAGHTYSFNLFAARSSQYLSMSKTTMKEENFNKPAVLRVYGGKDCTNTKLLISTKVIEHTNWVKYVFVFDAEEEIEFILIEANHDISASYPYNGNILIDNISPIYKITK